MRRNPRKLKRNASIRKVCRHRQLLRSRPEIRLLEARKILVKFVRRPNARNGIRRRIDVVTRRNEETIVSDHASETMTGQETAVETVAGIEIGSFFPLIILQLLLYLKDVRLIP